MRTRIWHGVGIAALVAVSLVLAASAGARTLAGAPEVSISGVSPTHAMAGQLVTISGANLDGTRGVAFGGRSATSVSVDPNGTWVRVVVPSGVTPGTMYISLDVMGSSQQVGPFTVDAGSTSPQPNPQPSIPSSSKTASSAAHAKVVVAPRITSLSRLSGAIGTKVQILGANFAGVKWVKFGTRRAHFTVASSSMIVATVPKHVRSAKVWVHTSGGTSSSTQRFKVVAPAA